MDAVQWRACRLLRLHGAHVHLSEATVDEASPRPTCRCRCHVDNGRLKDHPLQVRRTLDKPRGRRRFIASRRRSESR